MTQEIQSLPRLVIAAPQGRSGKTTVAVGLSAAFKGQGYVVQPYKKGPDYIDPSWLSEAAGRACHSLDPFFYDKPGSLLQAFVRSAQGAALSLIEGNHGLFDSFDEAGLGSSAAVARALDAPILLVVNAARLGRSIAAIVGGCQTFEPDTHIAGVVLNNVAQSRHEARLRQAIESHCGLPVVGAIPRDDRLTIPSRHLGLVPRAEEEVLLSAITNCQQAIEKHLDLDMVWHIARSAPPLSVVQASPASQLSAITERPRIGVMRDRAFTFYYPENLGALEDAGAKLVFINALSDPTLPRLDALYIGGGFPEIFMNELSANVRMRQAIRKAVLEGLPVYAECGGMMYLSQRIRWGERAAEMAGVLPCEIEMTDRPQGHGYVIAQVDQENPFFAPGTILLGHEFHNSRVVRCDGFHGSSSGEGKSRLKDNAFAGKYGTLTGEQPFNSVYRLSRGKGLGDGRDGIVINNVLASYTHLHVGGSVDWAKSLVNRAQLYRESQPVVGSLA